MVDPEARQHQAGRRHRAARRNGRSEGRLKLSAGFPLPQSWDPAEHPSVVARGLVSPAVFVPEPADERLGLGRLS